MVLSTEEEVTTKKATKAKRKAQRKGSKVWDRFKPDTKANTVECIHCKTALSYHNSTSSTLQHLHRRHPVYAESGRPSPEAR